MFEKKTERYFFKKKHLCIVNTQHQNKNSGRKALNKKLTANGPKKTTVVPALSNCCKVALFKKRCSMLTLFFLCTRLPIGLQQKANAPLVLVNVFVFLQTHTDRVIFKLNVFAKIRINDFSKWCCAI